MQFPDLDDGDDVTAVLVMPDGERYEAEAKGPRADAGSDPTLHTCSVKTIGFIGGMSWESTATYYRLTNELVRDRLGGLHSAPSITYSVDFAEVEALQHEGRWDDAAELLGSAARALEAAGADLVVLCTNTMHKVAPAIVGAVTIPFLHIGDATAEAVIATGITDVGLLGTAYTMEQDFYRKYLEGRGLRVTVPDSRDRAEVHRVIYEELCVGRVLDESRHRYCEIVDRLVDAGAEGVILGCTEIELLISAADSSVPVFPTTAIHVAAAVAAALDDHKT